MMCIFIPYYDSNKHLFLIIRKYFSFTTVPYCNDGEVTFYNSSSFDIQDSIGTDSLELYIMDTRGCTDIFIDDEIDIVELDVMVEIPRLDYVTWSDSGVVIVWNEIRMIILVSSNFKSIK